mmetsp:Transcript_15235/g.25307  ORF Transcript_15235/g.25307 Transcript_15235/m.25307 type:complete len:105 (+) Transcript_15235:528-842(+)
MSPLKSISLHGSKSFDRTPSTTSLRHVYSSAVLALEYSFSCALMWSGNDASGVGEELGGEQLVVAQGQDQRGRESLGLRHSRDAGGDWIQCCRAVLGGPLPGGA